MSFRTFTVLFIWLNLAVWVAWDVWVFRAGGYDSTITAVIRETVRDHPWAAAMIGAIACHLLEKA